MVQRLAADSDAPRAARDMAVLMVTRLGRGHERADDLALAVSELVTNAILHGPDGHVQLSLTGTPGMIRVEVTDGGTAAFDWPVGDMDGHWGLGLVSIFSDRAGVVRDPSTCVWCEFDLA